MWKEVQDYMVHEKTLAKKANTLFWFSVKHIQISDNFYKIQKFLRMSWASVIMRKDLLHLLSGCRQPLHKKISLCAKIFSTLSLETHKNAAHRKGKQNTKLKKKTLVWKITRIRDTIKTLIYERKEKRTEKERKCFRGIDPVIQYTCQSIQILFLKG